MTAPERRKLAAVFFSDMVGFSSQMDADEAKTLGLLNIHNRLMEAEIERQEGRVVKTVGDAFMVEFASAVQATQCALDCLRSLRDYNEGVGPDDEIHVRIGIHVGDVVERGSDLFGEAVNIAARLEPMAPTDAICVSGSVFAQVRKKVLAEGEDLGDLTLKNISEPVRGYVLRPSEESLSPQPTLTQGPRPALVEPSTKRRNLALIVIAVVMGCSLFLSLYAPHFDGLVLEEVDGRSVHLRLEGERLGHLSWLWQPRWRAALAKEGLTPRAQSDLEIVADGTQARLPVAPSQDFDATTLPLPAAFVGLGQRSPLRYHLGMRVHYVRYKAEDDKATLRTFELLHQLLKASKTAARLQVTLSEDLGVTARPPEDYGPQSDHFLSSEIQTADLIDTSTYLAMVFSQRFRGQQAEGDAALWGGRKSPFHWLACNIGRGGTTHYRSLMITAAESPVAKAIPAQAKMTQARLQRLAKTLGRDEPMLFVYGNRASTSGYVIPCLEWGQSVESIEGIERRNSKGHRQTIDWVLNRHRDESVLGVVYDEMLAVTLADPDWAGAQARVLWRSGSIPHGGVLMHNRMLKRKRDFFEQAFAEIFARADAGEAIPWPDRQDVQGLTSCDQARFEDLEHRLRSHPRVGLCLRHLK